MKNTKIYIVLVAVSSISALLAARFGNIFVFARENVLVPFNISKHFPDAFFPAILISTNALCVFITASIVGCVAWWIFMKSSILRALGHGCFVGIFYATGTIVSVYIPGSLIDYIPGFTIQAYLIILVFGIIGFTLYYFEIDIRRTNAFTATAKSRRA